MSDIEAIVFDKDGTLFDFQATWGAVALHFLREVAPEDMLLPAAAAMGIDPESGRFFPDSVFVAETTDDLARVLSPIVSLAEAEIVGIADRVGTEAEQVPVVELSPCLTVLGRGRTLGVVTNDTEAPARAHLAAAGVAEFFAFVAGYDSGFGAKPGPGQLLAFAEATGIAPQATLMVGDSRHDLDAGRAAGMQTAGVLTGVAGRDDLVDLADVVLPDIGHLAAWIGESEQG